MAGEYLEVVVRRSRLEAQAPSGCLRWGNSVTALPGPCRFNRSISSADTLAQDSTIAVAAFLDRVPALTVPTTISGRPVTSVRDSPFSYGPGMAGITIGNSVTNIRFGMTFGLASSGRSDFRMVLMQPELRVCVGLAKMACRSSKTTAFSRSA